MRNFLLSAVLLLSCLTSCKKNAGPPAPVITGFAPSQGAPGILVTITGNFDTTMQEVGVQFNGVPAQVYGASGSSIYVFVPPQVTTGKLSVTVNNIVATTDSDFVALSGNWTQEAHPTPEAAFSSQRWLGIGFGIGDYGYMGFGTNNGADFGDLYQYDPKSNSWTQRSSLGLGMENLVAMVINDKAYVGIGFTRGQTVDSLTSQFYEYDPVADTWTRKADFPGPKRKNAFGVSAGGKGYVGLGYGSDNTNLYDVWQYDPSADAWTQKSNFPASGAYPNYVVAFSPDDQLAYIEGAGNNGAAIDVATKLFWRYNPATDSWTQMHNMPGGEMLFPSAMVVNGNGYILGGGQESWMYNAASDTWTQAAFYGDRIAGAAFGVNGRGYYGMGQQTYTALPYLDFWQFTP
jgi:N-acetylneuraminic acid mutarotase